ncbi:type 4a pilus biogenesis protein PilO [Patescibacteria group bacterium]|nr:type 4a pilus biogenesis protein PilO [Patescibacteria group bacterium]
MKGIIPILALIIAGGTFYFYIDPTYAEIRTLREEETTLRLALDRARELQEVRDQLISRKGAFRTEDLERLEKMLPDHVDNVRLALDMDSLAAQYSMRIRNVLVEKQTSPRATAERQVQIGPDERLYESMRISFTVSGPYATFRSFLADLETSLRLVDVESVSFSATDSGVYDFTVSLRTYWLKP